MHPLRRRTTHTDLSNALQGPRIALQPRQRQIYTVPFDTTLIKPCNEYYLNIDYRLASDRP